MKVTPLAFAAALAASLAPAAPASAAKPSFTAPAAAGATSIPGCLAQNLGPAPRTVSAVIHDADGGQLGNSAVEIPPGGVRTIVNTVGGQFGIYCEFTGLTRTVRGWLHVHDNGSTEVLLPAGK